ncbi:MAG: glycosyltransferase [Bryobacterales bacterium]|jgi:glycogen(starch) synthase|nr:glycosyltransferase [Bryobacterales bacterium]
MPGDDPELPRKILMTADAVGGVWQYAVDLCTDLAKSGVEVLLATLGPTPSSGQLGAIESVPGLATVHGDYALEWMENPWPDVDESGKWLLDQQQSFSADLIHLNGFSQAALPWERPVVTVGHSCVRSWWAAVKGCDPGPEWDEYTRRVRTGLDATNSVVVPSAAMGRSLSEEYGIPAQKTRVIHNSTRVPDHAGMQKEPFILAAGRVWDEAKNFGLLAAIAPRLDWQVRIAGAERGPDGGCKPSDGLQRLGPIPHFQLVEQLRHASIFAHPALYEPFGLSVLEAARSRCCLVLSNIPSLRELWDGAAVFLDPRDPDLWKFEMNELCRDFTRRRRLADLGAKRAQRYSSAAMLTGYLDLYGSLLSTQAKDGKAA